MTQYIGTTDSNINPTPVRFSEGPDAQSMPPFRACDSLDEELARLDACVSNFIGRLQPYSSQNPTAMLTGSTAEAAPPDQSGLEARIFGATVRVTLILRALDDMNSNLRL